MKLDLIVNDMLITSEDAKYTCGRFKGTKKSILPDSKNRHLWALDWKNVEGKMLVYLANKRDISMKLGCNDLDLIVHNMLITSEVVILEMNFKGIEDNEIPIGQYILLYDEILAKKIGQNLYEVYKSLHKDEVWFILTYFQMLKSKYDVFQHITKMEEERQERLRSLELTSVNYTHPSEKIEPKYKWTPHGTKRNRPWE